MNKQVRRAICGSLIVCTLLAWTPCAQAYPLTRLPETQSSPLSDGRSGTGVLTNPEQYWNENGYPPDVSFAFEAGGELRTLPDGTQRVYTYFEIGLVNATETRKAEIAALFAPECLLTFVPARYTHAQREAMLQQITARGEEGMVSAQLVRNTDWIHIVVRDEAFDTLAPLYQQLGGDMVRVEKYSVQAEDIFIDTTPPLAPPTQAPTSWLLPLLAVCMGGLLLLAGWRVHAQRAVLQTDSTMIEQQWNRRASKRAIVTLVRRHPLTPSDALWLSIQQSLNEQDE